MTNPIYTGYRPDTYAGLQIIESDAMVDTHEDWSRVRSPARARRRRHKHPQRIVITTTPRKDAFIVGRQAIMHPLVARAIREKIDSFAKDWSKP